ncbi:ABC transporter permease [Leclercia adecarboxylata]|jgi:simple sugar transport system permease protein|uniref:ABC transporter permease n=1 Tax=Leclercia adecarboxylata TaxID=83655 RepID=A0A7H0FGS8_9ENTR|nr:ABC transporter permease [Leclercia adecarboxylata]KFC98382.1 permease component of an ABC superfamily ribose/xylose/arabinose/galactoside transporter [Leclercia adecarboxylata ATCC 23216 = NBRC 102595]MBD1403547.1 ABC transporter permease [Leclercia adecarboxylata]MBM6634638.1 ABC transporter permease [Leclercia adecarboxylata]MCE9982425.1 ABC transporter permease [Leclercia adecarboxylata]MDC6620830.1 ABC transporter permease [Leclercia adecarboxylata]
MNARKTQDRVEIYLSLLIAVVVIAFSFLIPSVFWSSANFQSIASQMPILGVLALAMAVTILTGGINLSIIATMNACGLVMAWVATHYPPGISSMLLVLAAGLAMAIVIGSVIGFLIAVVRVSPILATLGIMTLLKGINILISKGSSISNFPDTILVINSTNILGVPLPLLVFLAVVAVLWVILEKSAFGRTIYLIGSNEQATHYSGINTRKTLIWVYILSSVLCVIAALLMMSKLNSAKASYGESYLLVSILAAVLGGVNPDGGFGKVFGMVMALILLQMLESGLNILGVSSYITMALWGGLLLAFIFLKGANLSHLFNRS